MICMTGPLSLVSFSRRIEPRISSPGPSLWLQSTTPCDKNQ